MKRSVALMGALKESNLFKLIRTKPIGDLLLQLDAVKDSSTFSVDANNEKAFTEVAGKVIVGCLTLQGIHKNISVDVLCVPLRLHSSLFVHGEFQIAPILERLPQINEDLFGSNEHEPKFCIGNIDQFKQRLVKLQAAPRTDDWKRWLSYCIELFDALSDISLNQLGANFSKIMPGAKLYFSFRQFVSDTRGHTERLYDAILSTSPDVLGKTCLAKIDDVMLGRYTTEELDPNFIAKVKDASPTYLLGHMDERTDEGGNDLKGRTLHALDNTQRCVTLAVDRLEQTEILAVNGPPGSGKTAMLKAVVAHQWVKAALDQDKCPIIVGVGGTNQSVKNIIGAFPTVMQKQLDDVRCSQLYAMHRWIEGPDNYGSFLPSSYELNGDRKKNKLPMSEADINEKAVIRVNNEISPGTFVWLGGNAVASDHRSLPKQTERYVQNANQYFSAIYRLNDLKEQHTEISSLDDAIARVHKEMTILRDRMVQDKANLFRQMTTLKQLFNSVKHALSEKKNETESFLNPICNTAESVSYYTDFVTLCIGEPKESWKIVTRLCREHLLDRFGVRNDALGQTEEDAAKLRLVLENNWEALRQQALSVLIENILDTRCRVLLFHLAARYWEGRYLKDMAKRILLTRTAENVEIGLRRLCMLTPCLVATTKTAPQFFSYRTMPGINEIPYLFGVADLMIIDEAGQADIRDCLPLLALTKRTIAVGDIDQIPPVMGKQDITALQEFHQCHLHQFYDDTRDESVDESYLKLSRQRFLPVAGGSILHVLRHASRYSILQPGLMLRGHYRCQRQISQFCNELVYKNQIFISEFLFNARGPLPPMSFVESSGKTQVDPEDSRFNTVEAGVIADWLITAWPDIRVAYNASRKGKWLKDYVAIISPYAAQAREVLRALRKRVQGNTEQDEDICLSDLDGLTCGTIDSLQGAEKNIILFSAAKGIEDGGTTHYDEKPYVLNVAVSRAKQSFVAFVCPHAFGLGLEHEPKRDLEGRCVESMKYLGFYLTRIGAKRLFPKHLVVIEAAGKQKALAAALGPSYEVAVTDGAILKIELGQPKKAGRFVPQYQWQGENDEERANKKFKVTALLDKMTDANFESVILATDDDLVGECIAWQLQALLKHRHSAVDIKLTRVLLRAMDVTSIKNAFKQPTTVNIHRAKAEIARSIADNVGAFMMTEKIKSVPDGEQSPLSRLAIEHHLITPCVEKNMPAFGRVKRAVLEILYEHLTKQATYICSGTHRGVMIQINGKTLHGELKRLEGSSCALPPNETLSAQLWQVYDSRIEERFSKLVPESSTINVLMYAYVEKGLSVKDAYNALKALYEGVIINGK